MSQPEIKDSIIRKFKGFPQVTVLDAARYLGLDRNRLRKDLIVSGVSVSALGGRGYRVSVTDLAEWAATNKIKPVSDLQPAGFQGELFC